MVTRIWIQIQNGDPLTLGLVIWNVHHVSTFQMNLKSFILNDNFVRYGRLKKCIVIEENLQFGDIMRSRHNVPQSDQ